MRNLLLRDYSLLSKFVIVILLFLTILQFKVGAQNKLKSETDWQILLEDSLVLSGSLNTNYASRPSAIVDIDDGDTIKKVVFIFKNSNAFESKIEFRENDSVLFEISGYYAERPVGDTLVLERESELKHYISSFRRIKGKTVKVFYSDDKLQTTPTLLGTLIVKKD